MNIWLINPFDELPGEGPEQRYACLARHLSDRGHAVTWITADFHHRKKEMRSAECGVRNEENEESGKPTGAPNAVSAGAKGALPISHLPYSISRMPYSLLLISAPPYTSNTSLRRLRSHRIWARNVRAHLLQQVKSGGMPPPDLILASTPPLEGAAAAVKLGQALHAKIVVDVMDRWPENWLTLLPSARPVQALGRLLLTPWTRLARRVFREPDALCAQSQAFADYAANRGQRLARRGGVERRSDVAPTSPTPRSSASSPPKRKLWSSLPALPHSKDASRPSPTPHVCHLGASPRMPYSVSRIPRACEPFPSPTSPDLSPLPSNLFQIVYLGAMGRFYDIETVLQAMAHAKRDGRLWQLTLAGTDPEGIWQRRVAELGLEDSVSLPGYLQKEALETTLTSSHVGLIPMNPSSGVAVPYKVGDYLSHGIPIISSLPGELETHLLQSGAGLQYRFGDPVDLFRVLSTVAEDAVFRTQAPAAAKSLFETHFNREITYPLWAQWLENIAP